jgi:hypothetical protein
MKSSHFATFLAGACLLAGSATAAESAKPADPRFFELRTYWSPEGKLPDLQARFRNHTLGIFKKHGIESVAYWVPVDNKENKLVYLLAYPSKEAREKSWKEFFADAEWKEVAKKTEANGKIVAKVESTYLIPTDYSAVLKTGDLSKGGVFEMRTYTANEGKLPNLDARFRDHTVKLFEKHGMMNYGYFHVAPGGKGSETTLLYFLSHKSQAAAKESFGAFGKDEAWKAAKDASEKAAGGSLTIQGGVKSEFLVPTGYSPTK